MILARASGKYFSHLWQDRSSGGLAGRGRGGELLQAIDQFVPECAENAEGNHRLAVDVSRETSQHVGRSAEPAKLLAERLIGQRMLPGFLARLIRRRRTRKTGFGCCFYRHRLADGGMNDQIDSRSPLWIGRRKGLPQPAGQLGIVVLPNPHARVNLGEIDRAVSEGQLNVAG
jgi:hypothetical protein